MRGVEARPVVDLVELPGVMWRRRRWIAGATLAMLALAVAFAVLVKPTYLSATRLLIDPRGLQVVDRELSPRGPSSEINLAVVESQMRVLTSDNVLKRVIEKLGLVNDAEFAARPRLMARMRAFLPVGLAGGADASDPIDPVLNEFRKAIKAERLQNSFIVDLSVTSEDREKAARIANAVATVYMDAEASNREGLAVRASGSLSSRLTELKTKVRVAEDAVETYKRQKNIVITGGTTGGTTGGAPGTPASSGSGGTLFSDQELTQLNQQLAQVRTLAAQAQSRAEQIERVLRSGASPDSIAEAVQSQTIAQLRVRLSLAQQQAASLAVDLMPGHPSMIAARARVSDASTQVRAELNRIALAARADQERTQASERELAASLERAKRQRSTTDQARVQLREMEREADASRAIYETFLLRARELGAQTAVDPTNARVISTAVPPSDPKGLRLSLLLPLSLLSGFGLGCVLALAREHLDPIVRTAGHAGKAAGLQVLAVLPVGGGRGERGGSPALMNDYRGTPAAAAIGRVRAALGHAEAAGGARSVLVAAIGDQDGNSTVAFNLALSAGERGEKVLLIGGDRGRVATVASNDQDDRLCEVMQDRVPLEKAVVLDPTGVFVRLRGEPGGRTPARSSAAAVRRLLVEKCRGFDLVIVTGGGIGIDCMTNVFADAVDDIVPVASNNQTRKDEIPVALEKLGRHQEKIRGMVLVDA